jgi:hypothetical protein
MSLQRGLVEFVVAKYHEAVRRQQRYRAESDAAGREKVLALKALHERAGMSYAQIGAAVGLSAPRVGQLLTGAASKPLAAS